MNVLCHLKAPQMAQKFFWKFSKFWSYDEKTDDFGQTLAIHNFFCYRWFFFSILVCIQDIGKYQKLKKKVVLFHYLPTYTVCPIWKVKCDMGWTIRAIKNLMAHYGLKLLILPSRAHFWLDYSNFLLINLVSLIFQNVLFYTYYYYCFIIIYA